MGTITKGKRFMEKPYQKVLFTSLSFACDFCNMICVDLSVQSNAANGITGIHIASYKNRVKFATFFRIL